ncbi:MAG: PD40 domain-containing protein [Chloroflexi bacterium]|nr:PD40 domain-containing protein [Chloroflexota bacterium]MCI0856297.1 PD40 domain-containing protein [Chloroflexota bacterium]MCI0889809.1 PD40 domain-containing protein [Chloroflexota bacterium]
MEQLAESDDTGGPIDAALFRVGLEGGGPEELHAFESRGLSPFSAPSALISPDGRHVLLTDFQGIVLLDLGTGTARRLLRNSPPCEGPINCYGYRRPIWSPGGELALIGKGVWEGGSDKIIDPFAEEIEERDTPGGGSFTPRWSPDGQRLCVSEFTYSSAGAALVYDLATGETTDATLDLPLPTSEEEGRLRIDTRSCVWSPLEGLAISFNAPDNYIYGAIAIFDNSFKLLHQSDLIENLADVVDYLPDGSGVVYNRWHAQGGGARQPGIYYPDRGLIELSIEADAVLAVIPLLEE